MKKIFTFMLLFILTACTNNEVAIVVDNEGIIHREYCTPNRGQLHIENVVITFTDNREKINVKGELSRLAENEENVQVTLFVKFVFQNKLFQTSDTFRIVTFELFEVNDKKPTIFETVVELPKVRAGHEPKNLKQIELSAFY